MDPVTLGLIAMGVGGAVKLGADLFDDTADKQASLMRQQAAEKQSALEESMRRAEGAQTQVLSSTKARMAGTGFDSSSTSFTDYLGSMAEQFSLQNAFAREQGGNSIARLYQTADMLADPKRKILRAAGDVAGTVMGMARLTKPAPGGDDIGLWDDSIRVEE